MSATVLAPPTHPPRTTPPIDLVWRLSVEQYHQMIHADILTENDPVELLEGVLVTKMPKKPLHHIVTYLLRQQFERLLPAGWFADSQEAITLADSEPEPDVVVVRGDIHQYTERHPTPSEVALVVEVADSTLQHDRTTKKRLYARAGIPVYWIANVPEQLVEVYTQPRGTGDSADYAQRKVYGLSESVPLVLAGVEVGRVNVGELWGDK